MPVVHIWNDRLTIDTESLNDGNPFVENGIICYTDGSKMDLEDVSLGVMTTNRENFNRESVL